MRRLLAHPYNSAVECYIPCSTDVDSPAEREDSVAASVLPSASKTYISEPSSPEIFLGREMIGFLTPMRTKNGTKGPGGCSPVAMSEGQNGGGNVLGVAEGLVKILIDR